MKLILACCLVAAVAAAPQKGGNPKDAQIVAYENNISHDGTFNYRVETSDGLSARQAGQLKQIGQEAGEVVQGEFSYVGDDGQNYALQYTADENGYQPQGAHLPTPPPTPEAVIKLLAYLATAPPPKEGRQ